MKSKTRKVLALLLCLLVCLGSAPAAFALGERTEARWPVPPAPSAGDGAFPGTADRVFAAADSYNAAAAASYALKWWNSFNMQWYNWEAESYSDCANFVSQCLYAGGMKMSADWYWISRDNYNDAWTTAHKLAVYLASKGYAFELFPTAGQISLGDVLFYDWNQDGTFDHSAICVNDSGDSRYVCCHSNAHCTADYTLGAARYMVIRLNGTRGTVYPGKPALTGMSASYEAGKPTCWGKNRPPGHTNWRSSTRMCRAASSSPWRWGSMRCCSRRITATPRCRTAAIMPIRPRRRSISA